VVVVVVSILVAFLLDAWWGDREWRHQLDQELASVGREVDSNRALIGYEVNSLERHVAAGEAVIHLPDGASSTELALIPDTLAWFVAFWSLTLDWTCRPVLATLSWPPGDSHKSKTLK